MVKGIVHRNDHMKKNVKSIEFGEYKTFRSRQENLFDHSLWIRLLVDTSRLWENGQQEWKLGDGTIMTANRIHVKY